MPRLAQRQTEADFDIDVDWAPAYELLISFTTFADCDKHCLDELGDRWLSDVRERLPAEFKDSRRDFNHKQDAILLLRLARGCPVARDADSFLEWLGQLSPGDAYETLNSVTPAEDDVQLPRDFSDWRDRMMKLLWP